MSVASIVDRPQSSSKAMWLWAIAAALAGIAGLVAIFHGTSGQVLSLWLHSSAYNHSFLILPIALYVIWDRRRLLTELQPKPCFSGLILFPLFSAGWWVARSVGIAEGEQLALACLLQAVLLTVLGWRVYGALLFPFTYLMLMIPTGEFLLGPLQRLSVAVVAIGLRMIGMPVFVEGTLIEIPIGSFVVAPGCAGLNFLLTALALSLLIANLLYRSWRKRGLCVAIALACAVATNWIRIWGILVFDDLTGGRTSIVDDHLFYGWGFFAVVMFALLWLAQRFRDPADSATMPSIWHRQVAAARWPAFAAAAASGVFLAALLPILASARPEASAGLPGSSVELPAMIGPWRVEARPATPPPAHRAIYVSSGWRVDLSITRRAAADGKAGFYVDPGDPEAWAVAGSQEQAARVEGAPVVIRTTHYTMGGRRRTVWQWYRIGGQSTPSQFVLIWLQARAALMSPDRPVAAIRVSIDYNGGAGDADAMLREFVGDLDLQAILRAAPSVGGG